jgi:hypothetical protein
MSAGIRITIDAKDAADAPELPFALFVQAEDADGLASKEMADWGESAILGTNIPTMLRELADLFEAGRVEHDDEPLTVDLPVPAALEPAPEAHTATYLASAKYPNLFTAVCSCGESSFGASLRGSAEAGQERHAANPSGGHYRDAATTALLFPAGV